MVRKFLSKNKYSLVSFISIFFVSFCVIFFTKQVKAYDAMDYWMRGQLYVSGKPIDAFRGYALPLFLGICNKINMFIIPTGRGYFIWKIANSILIAVTFSFLLPSFHMIDKTKKQYVIKNVINFSIIFILFLGIFVYTLSDFFAFFLFISAIVLKDRFLRENIFSVKCLYAMSIGIFLYLSYNVRTIYMFAGIFVFLMFIKNMIKFSLVKKIIFIFCFCIGIFLASIPQIFLNHKSLGTYSITVPTASLMKAQLFWGLRCQRYDTYFGVSGVLTEQQIPQMTFVDPVGAKLIEKEKLTGFPTFSSYFKFVFKYPLECAGIYVRHLLNCLFPSWSQGYVQKISNNKVFYTFLGITLIFSFAFVLFKKFIKKSSFIINYIPMLVPVLFILPGAVEFRFFLPLFLLITGTLCYETDWIKVKEYFFREKLKVIILYLIFAAFMISQWGIFLMSETEIPITFWGN